MDKHEGDEGHKGLGFLIFDCRLTDDSHQLKRKGAKGQSSFNAARGDCHDLLAMTGVLCYSERSEESLGRGGGIEAGGYS